MSKKRRSYTREYKADAVRLVSEEGYTIAGSGPVPRIGVKPIKVSN